MNLVEKKNFLINFLYFAACTIVIYLLFKFALLYMFPFLIGFLIAYLVQRPALYLSKKVRLSKQICSVILAVLIYFVLIFLFIVLIWLLYSQLTSLVENFSVYKEEIITFIDKLKLQLIELNIGVENATETVLKDTISNLLLKLGVYLTNVLTAIVKNTPNILLSLIITIVASCYIAKDYDKFLKFIKGIFSRKILKKSTEIIDVFKEYFLKFLFGYFKIFLITFSELLCGFLILDIDNFLLIALFVAIVDILPVFGTGIVLLPWAVFKFTQGDFFMGIGLIVLYGTITVIRNFIEPKIIGNQMDINPVFTLIFLFIGFKIGGILGMLFLPIALTVFFNYYRRKFSYSE